MQPFTLHHDQALRPILVEIPHAGIWLPPDTLPFFTRERINAHRDADRYVDELYAGCTDLGATLLTANWSRYVVDLNRAERDSDAGVVVGGSRAMQAPRGVVWRIAGNGQPLLNRPLPREEFERRMAICYRPYHATITATIEALRAKFGHVLVIAAHSMPSHASGSGRRADVVPGTRGGTSTDPAFLLEVEAVARDAGLSVVHDDPYSGGFTTTNYGRPRHGVSVIQIELARDLYLNEQTYEKDAGKFERIRHFCLNIVARLGAMAEKRNRKH